MYLNTWRKQQLYNKDGDLIIRTQDKGNRFVIVDKVTDKEKAKQQIQRSSFVTLEHDPTLQHIQKVKDWAEKWFKNGEISKQWKEYIVNENACPGKNSTLYKTHKAGTPVRLLTSGCNTAIENLARFLEVICAPFTENMRSRIKNTSHLLDIIDSINEKGIPDHTQLVSFDIVNMFPSIDNRNGLDSVRKIMDKRIFKKPSTECIMDALDLCLYNNNSVFANEHLLQTNGTATGAPNSCSYADIAVSSIDDAVFEKMHSSYPEILYFGRYRDDCLSLWCGSNDKLQEFFVFMNSINQDLKFTMEIGGDKLCFLDLQMSLKDNKISTTVYSKPTDTHLYLHATSCHNKSSIRGIPKGIALRLRRICSNNTDYNEKSNKYCGYLTKRGYNKSVIKKTFQHIGTISRCDARKKITRNNSKTRVIFSTKFNPRGPDIKTIVQTHMPIISNHPDLSRLFPENSILVAYKRENNLRDLILRADPYNIKSDLSNDNAAGYVKCKNKKCDSCKNYVIETTFVVSKATGRKFKIRRESSCSSKNVIYVAFCKLCGKQGVGSTVAWKPRLSNYKSHIKKKIPSCKVVKHFIDECPNASVQNIGFIIVDVVNNGENLTNRQIDSLLLDKEKFWIGTLVTQHQGLNGSHDWNRTKRTEKCKL
ncbi:uncharacterized protein LOC130636829 [Hydractinia symbiolongicarpus]|uniref:uncharacterized protein LOC130636829 n=1 Tax=Hydractinia symbiolongicarpus TaxID=13093 RepID=UPI00254CE245|nr:uncharacterized protein LOC130636829 [Hydractinia symbiolongicarpus]